MIVSMDAEKTFNKIQHCFMIKILQKMRMERTYLNIGKAIYGSPTANIILSGEKQKALPSRSEIRFSPLLFNIIQEVLATSIRGRKKKKRVQIGKEEVKLSLFPYDVVLYIANPKDATQRCSLMNSVNLQGTQLIYRDLLHFYTFTMNNQKDKLRKQSNLPLSQQE